MSDWLMPSNDLELVEYWRKEATALRAEVERLNLAIKKQAASARMGMDAAKAIAASNVREASRLYAESNPSALDSERTANQLLTDEIDSLRRDLEAARAELADRREHMRRGIKQGMTGGSNE
jgi:uncharacterized protein with von Willebrand factor type A (vWA) domain